MPDRVEAKLGRPEQLFGEVSYYAMQRLPLPPSIAAAWQPYAGLRAVPRKPNGNRLYTENQERLLAYALLALGDVTESAAENAREQARLLDNGEPGSGYRTFYRFFDLGTALEAHRLGHEELFRLALGSARRGIAYDALFAAEMEGRIWSTPPGIRCGGDPGGWPLLEYILEGAPRGNPWPQWQWTNHRPALPVLACKALAAVGVVLFTFEELAAMRAWVFDRRWSAPFAALLGGVTTRWSVRAAVDDRGILRATFTGDIVDADNIVYQVILRPEAIALTRANRAGVDFYGSAFMDGESVRYRGRLHHKVEDRNEDYDKLFPKLPLIGGIVLTIDHRQITLNGKPIEGGAVPDLPKPEPQEPNWGVARRQIEAGILDLREALRYIDRRESGWALSALDDEELPGATQALRRALAALRGEI